MPEADESPSGGLDLEPIAIPTDDPLAPLPIATDDVASLSDVVDTGADFGLADPSFWDSSFLWDMPILAASIAGFMLATLGIYVVLARAAFVSAAVSQLAGLGVVLAMLFAGGAAHAATELEGVARWSGLLLGTLGAGLFAIPSSLRRTSTDAILATAVIAATAFTLVGAGFLTREYRHVQNALYGDAVVASVTEVIVLAIVAVVLLSVERLLRGRLLFVLFDSETASAQGMAVKRLSIVMGLGISGSVALVTALIGALPAFAFSVLPATTALLVTDRIGRAFAIAGGLAVFAAAVGYYVAFELELPVGPSMVALLIVPLFGAGVRQVFRR